MNFSASGRSSSTNEPMIGVVGSDIPRQIILAAHATPVRLFGAWEAPINPEAAQMLGAADAVAIRLLDDLLSRRWDSLAGLVVSNDSMANLRLFYVARLLSKQGRLPFPIHLIDLPPGTGAPRRRFATRQFGRLAHFTEQITGRTVDGKSTLSSAGREKQVGDALSRLRQRRLSGRCSGAEALGAYKAAVQKAPEEAVEMIDSAGTAGIEDAPRLFVTGSSHPDETVYAVLESTGRVIVSEDHDSGDSSWVGQAVHETDPETFLERLASHHANRPPLSPRALTHERVNHLTLRIEETNCVGVAAVIREFDDAPVWDLPRQRDELQARRIPLAARVRIPPEGALQAAHSVLDEMTQHRWGNLQ